MIRVTADAAMPNSALALIMLSSGLVLILCMVLSVRAVRFESSLLAMLGLLSSATAAFTIIFIIISSVKTHYPAPRDELESALTSTGLTSNQAKAVADEALGLETGENMRFENVTVVRGEERTFFVGVEKQK